MLSLLRLLSSTLPVIFPILLWAVLLAFVLAILFAFDDGIKRLKKLHQIPCDRCRFNTGSHYLKCSVNPLTAYSEAAIHCRDYERIPHRRLSFRFLKYGIEQFKVWHRQSN